MTDSPSVPPPEPAPVSPRWAPATKFLVSLVIVTLVGALLIRFRSLLSPLALALILAYLLNPVVEWLARRTRLAWGAAVLVVFAVIALLLLGVIVAAGIAIAQQVDGLYRAIVELLPNLPDRLRTVFSQPIELGPFRIDPTRPFSVGPFTLDLSTLDLTPWYNQLVAYVQPMLSRAGALAGTLASGTAEVVGWGFFILIGSYYLLHDLKNLVPSLEQVVARGYAHDVRRMAAELGPIWNAFLRGQITLGLVMGVIVGVAMAILGVRYALVLGLLAGLLEFIPIVGPLVSGAVAILIALFQPGNWWGLPPIYFALLVLGVQLLLQQLENNFLVPYIIGGSLNLHPLVILVGAIIAANLAGLVGLLLSAPLIASLRLFGRYISRKLRDQDPWPEPPPQPPPRRRPAWPRWLRRLRRGKRR